MTVTLERRSSDGPEPGPAHPQFCDPRSCEQWPNGTVEHRSVGLTLDSEDTGPVKVFAARCDDSHDTAMFGETGTPFVALSFDVRTLWSATWRLPNDDITGTMAIDLAGGDAGWVGGLLLNTAEGARHCPNHRFDTAQVRTDTDDQISMYSVRVAGTGERYVVLALSVGNLWSTQFGEFETPRLGDGGPVCLLLSVQNAMAVGEALLVANRQVGQALGPDGIAAITDARDTAERYAPPEGGITVRPGLTIYPRQGNDL